MAWETSPSAQSALLRMLHTGAALPRISALIMQSPGWSVKSGFRLIDSWGAVVDGGVDLKIPIPVTLFENGVTFGYPPPVSTPVDLIGIANVSGGIASPLEGNMSYAGGGTPGTSAISGADAVYNQMDSLSGLRLLSLPVSVPLQLGNCMINAALQYAILEQMTARTDSLPVPLPLFDTATPTYIRLYSGSPPASADTVASGVLLGELGVLRGDYQYTTNSLGSALSLKTTRTFTPKASGVVGYARYVAANGVVIQCSVGTSLGGIVLNTLSAVTGVPLTLIYADIYSS